MAEQLKRRIGTGLLTAYGVGVMVGAGIYVLVGIAAGQAGIWAPLSFLFAAAVAIPTALTFSELSARIPEAAGDSVRYFFSSLHISFSISCIRSGAILLLLSFIRETSMGAFKWAFWYPAAV